MNAVRVAALVGLLGGCDRLFQLAEVKIEPTDGDAGPIDTRMPDVLDIPCTASFSAPVPLPVGTRPYAVVVEDLNDDGILDIVSANADSDDVTVLLGTGGGAFGIPNNIPVGDKPVMVAVGSLTADSFVDVAVALAEVDAVRVLAGDGNGSFVIHETYALPPNSEPYAVLVEDLDGNGTDDIATANYGTDDVGIFLFNAPGIPSLISRGAGQGPLALAATRLDGDPYIDLIAVNFNSNSLSLFRGDPSGTFLAAPTTANVGLGPNHVAVGNLLADSGPEVLVANYSGNSLTAYGNQNGVLVQPMEYLGLGTPWHVGLTDFDKNGLLDVVVTESASAQVRVTFNNGSITTADPIAVPAGTEPTGLALADLDGSGYPDIIVTNNDAGTVSVMFNCGP